MTRRAVGPNAPDRSQADDPMPPWILSAAPGKGASGGREPRPRPGCGQETGCARPALRFTQHTFRQHSNACECAANKQPPLSCFHACAAWRHETACIAPWNGLFRAAKRHIREARTAPVGNSLNASGLDGVAVWWHRNTGLQRPQAHSSATRRRPPGRHHNFWGDANQKKPKIKDFITWNRYHFCKK